MTAYDAHDRDVKNLRRRTHNHGRTVRDQAHVEGLRLMRTHRPEAVVSHLVLALAAEGVSL